MGCLKFALWWVRLSQGLPDRAPLPTGFDWAARLGQLQPLRAAKSSKTHLTADFVCSLL